MSFGYDKNNIVSTKKVKIRSDGDNPAVERLWAIQKIKNLELDSDKNEQEILKLGKKYSIVTGFTSLIVLENADDYVTYKIKPPQELMDEYRRIEDLVRKEEKNKKAAALEDAVLQVQDIKDWWKHDYGKQNQTASNEHAETAFGVKQSRIFRNAIPPASEGEVKAPECDIYEPNKTKDMSFNKICRLFGSRHFIE